MQLSICTISFRHHLVSLENIAEWARSHDFQGIELWGAHALGLEHQPQYDAKWINEMGLSISMLSDYLPIVGDEREAEKKCQHICRLANYWDTSKVRTFAGHQASDCVDAKQRKSMARRLHQICCYAADLGIDVLVETHPGTLADTPNSTLQLLDEVNHPALKLNFDTLHVWEAGEDPVAFHRRVAHCVGHYHLKNVRSREQLNVFSPHNVYSPAGSRYGMVPLLEGAMDYHRFLPEVLRNEDSTASLEWFGNDVKKTLLVDKAALESIKQNLHMYS
ncbi:sugar phosphate isomerase/epimerase [Enterovibrio makurazakiensis]|uniref:Sugar phosphate isomerase/epimerase n=1 Tax=Enterovibrio gelatinilyticus TaxID=2899819 RepID=A0ABT5R8X2_9GAMM|nr:sugar phosphate isomerase/epimerase [Enterovibrio sp. ZSDZ42]MDD1795972.1 sugar phosphate isomerase/epimerase [Enterovibrio sp. ZSDZ42]